VLKISKSILYFTFEKYKDGTRTLLLQLPKDSAWCKFMYKKLSGECITFPPDLLECIIEAAKN